MMCGGSEGVPRIGKAPAPLKGGAAPRMGSISTTTSIFWNMGTNWVKERRKKKKKKSGEGLLLGKNSPFNGIPIVGNHTLKFRKDAPLSNYDLMEWCEYLRIPIDMGGVLSRDQTVPHNHKMAFFIYNLEPSYMSGSHWVATFVKDRVINYFDSFGSPPFQEIVNHAREKESHFDSSK